MKKYLYITLVFALTSLSASAQEDDMYFTPKKVSKAERQAAKEAEEKRKDYVERHTISGRFYAGSSRDVDEYNRRGKANHTTNDSVASDVITFTPGTGVYPDSLELAHINDSISLSDLITYEKSKKSKKSNDDYSYSDEDFTYSRGLSRYYDYYGPYWGPWRYDPFYYGWGYHSYYSSYYPWYDPWYDPWYYSYYDPWYYGYGYGWGIHYGWGYHHHHWGGPVYVYGGGSYGTSGRVTGTQNHGTVRPHGNFRTSNVSSGISARDREVVTTSRRSSSYSNASGNFSGRRNTNTTSTTTQNNTYSAPTRTTTTTTSSNSSFGGSRSGGSFSNGGGNFSSGGGSRSSGGGSRGGGRR